MKLKPLAEILAMTKEGIDAALAPSRARAVRARADMAVATLEEKSVSLERQVFEACAKKDIDFNAVVDLMDEKALVDRRIEQLRAVVAELFPTT